MSAPRHAQGPEFSRLFAVEPGMGEGPDALSFSITADARERAALAVRFGLVAIDALGAEGTIEVSDGGRRARLTARLRADVVQSCVVTLEPVASHIEDTFSVAYERDAGAEEGAFEAIGEDLPEPLEEAGIDVGEAVAEQLGLAIDPYPRAPGARVELLDDGTAAGEGDSPFAALARLRGGSGPKSG